MKDLLIRGARVLTMAHQQRPVRGAEMSELNVLPRADVLVSEGLIQRVSTDAEPASGQQQIIEAEGRVLMPAFVDCHTHACWAGSRLEEWQQKLQGASYLQLLEAGGGIMATVRAVRSASQETLAEQLRRRLMQMLCEGTTSVEVKSGYGLDTESELKMLRAIRAAASRWPGQVRATACLGHALDPEVETETFIQQVIQDTLPAVSSEFPGIPIDAYCEEGAWSREDCLTLFAAAQKLGHPIRVHADQFHSTGLVPRAIEHSFLSVDHLEATTPSDLDQLARSNVAGVMLPCTGFHLDNRYANGRRFVEQGGS